MREQDTSLQTIQRPHLSVRPEWLALWESPFKLERELADAHHHSCDRPPTSRRSLLPELLAATAASEHRLTRAVHVRPQSKYRSDRYRRLKGTR